MGGGRSSVGGMESGGGGGLGGDDANRPSIGIRSDLLPQLAKDGGLAGGVGGLLGDITGLPALEALRRQAGYQNPFLSSLTSPVTPSSGGGGTGLNSSGLSLTSKRPSQPPTPQSSTSGGDPSSAWSFEEQFKQVIINTIT